MLSLKIADRAALLAMLSTCLAIPLTACASIDGAASAKPDATVALRDGVERRFYATGPMGLTTLRVDVASDGTVLARNQVLDSAVFQAIRPGMRAAEVFERLGPPYRKERFARLGATAWDYHFRDGWGYDAEFSVMVDDQDVVISKIATRLGG
jgi:outer membrane protein assembly factor BamE (lipoprotein component of BamABCDE complex)